MKNLLNMTVTLSGNVKQFVGLWETIDFDDGSRQLLSISENDDGTVKLHFIDASFTLCSDGRANAQDFDTAAAQQSFLTEDITITCSETGDIRVTPATVSENSEGVLTRLCATLSPLIYRQKG